MTQRTISESIKEIKEMAATMTALGDLQKAEVLNRAADNMEQLLFLGTPGGNAGHQPTTSVTTQPPNVGSGVQPPKKDEKKRR